MLRFFLRRLLLIPLAVLLVNGLGFAYAHAALRFHASQNPYGSAQVELPPILELYAAYLWGVLAGDLGWMPVGAGQPLGEVLLPAAGASLGLLSAAFGLSAAAGVALGLGAVRAERAVVSSWLAPWTSLGLAAPSFFIGALFLTATVWYLLTAGEGARPPLPLGGFGWDLHLVVPVLALALRPAAQTAQVVSSLLAAEMRSPYVIAALSRGNSWRRVRWRHALGNILAAVVLSLAGAFRLLVGELLLVEWLFGWPGLGRLLVLTLIPPSVATVGGLSGHTLYFLHPPLVAALLSVFAFLFVLLDTLASGLARAVDPRLRLAAEERRRG